MKKIAETERLIIRELRDSDADFIYRLLNSPSFLKYIGDRGVRSVDDAREFIETRYRKSYEDNGFGLYAVETRLDGLPVGICGLVNRQELEKPDLGFAFLPECEGKGFGFESASAVLHHAKNQFDIEEVWAIATPDNFASHNLLAKLGFEFEKDLDSEIGDRLKLFVRIG